MLKFQNTTPDYHAYLADRKRAELKTKAQGTDGLLWIMLLAVAFAWLCKTDTGTQALESVTVHKYQVASVGNRPCVESWIPLLTVGDCQ